jgi:hypothetical protein
VQEREREREREGRRRSFVDGLFLTSMGMVVQHIPDMEIEWSMCP